MKRNIFKLFLNKFFTYPLWVKQVVYYRLWQMMKTHECAEYTIEKPEEILSLTIPTLTFKGKQELLDKKGGFDSNIYNFLKFSCDGYTFLESAMNLFMSMKEVSKLYVFCVEQNLIEQPENIKVISMAEFISGKIKTGEYYLKIGAINKHSLNEILLLQKEIDEKGEHVLFGNLLIEAGYIENIENKNLFILKSESEKRFVMDPEILPPNCIDDEKINQYENKIKALLEENRALKNTMTKIVNAVKNYDI